MYRPSPNLDVISSWSHRSQLLKDRIGQINADVVCLQEVSPLSFEEDFAFMKDLGYDGFEMFKRGRFRPATFWRKSKLNLIHEPIHKDRTLLTSFQITNSGSAENGLDEEVFSTAYSRNWHVLNVHLQAGPEGKRRVRQIDDGVKSAFKLAKKVLEDNPASPILIVCGDFNGGSECGAIHYVEKGSVGPNFIEDGEPVSSKEKKSPLTNPLKDSMKFNLSREPPPTLVVSELISQMVRKGSEAYENPQLSQDILERLQRIYYRYASHSDSLTNEPVMTCEDVEKFLVTINRQVGRGDEFRNAAREMGWVEEQTPDDGDKAAKSRIELPKDGFLTLKGFQNIYQSELERGKFWGIAHDLSVLGEELPDEGLFTARFDRMFHSSSIVPTCVLDTVATSPCPSESEPSDHLPIAATFAAIQDLN